MDKWNVDPLGHLVAPALGIMTSAAVAIWFRFRRSIDFALVLAKVVTVPLLTARITFVFQHFYSYSNSPLLMLDVTDGGFSATAGLLTAFVLGIELTRKSAAVRRPLAFATLTGVLVWMSGTLAMLDFAPARVMVPTVEVNRLDGSRMQLRTFTHKPMVVNLWATWCPPCRREMPVLAEAQRRHPDVAFLFINEGDDTATISGYLGREGLQVDNVFADTLSDVSRRTASFAFPTTLFFDREGVLYIRQVGELSRTALEERLAMLRKVRDHQGMTALNSVHVQP